MLKEKALNVTNRTTTVMQPLNVRVPEKIIERLDAISKRNGISRSEIIRSSLIVYLNLLENLGEFVSLRDLKLFPRDIRSERFRDTSILHLKDLCVVISSTSSGAIGSKDEDIIKIDERELGRIMARCAIIKIISLGAHPALLVSNLSVEYHPMGARIFEGIFLEAKRAGVKDIVEGHTEENFKTQQTALSIVGVGITDEKNLKFGVSRRGDLIFVLGDPKVGYEVVGSEMIGIEDVKRVRKLHYVHDIIPVGRRGIKHQLYEFRGQFGHKIELNDDIGIDIEKSAGPSTSILISLDKRYTEDFQRKIKRGELIGKIL
ncbi:MAG: CopG family transcriptional regulator [Candidatus Methanolliviera hydrocarbonicum]|uniref:CopG family transcriptional regulator n=1 Tax=Candidatus Methanolliviera hydrocarbonicum TaxID=2491085 RepID=A0A520KWG6_9EURY|nr:MAG: CopG family transcriptional regulator [Candidatus Methanolliviera hydrocarbonicum]